MILSIENFVQYIKSHYSTDITACHCITRTYQFDWLMRVTVSEN